MADNYIPSKDADLLLWAGNYTTRIVASPVPYGLTAGQATALEALFTTFETALRAINDPGARTPAAIVAKNNAREALVDGPDGIRVLARIIQANPGVTDEQKTELGLTVRDEEPSPVPIPTVAPSIAIERILGRVIRIRLRDAENPDRRGKPDGVTGATIITYVGESSPPNDPMEWSFYANTTRTLFDVEVPSTVAAGSKIWIAAMWFNTKAQASPVSVAVQTLVADATAMTQAA